MATHGLHEGAKGNAAALKQQSIMVTDMQDGAWCLEVLLLVIVQLRIDEFYYATDATIKNRPRLFPGMASLVKDPKSISVFQSPEIVGQILVVVAKEMLVSDFFTCKRFLWPSIFVEVLNEDVSEQVFRKYSLHWRHSSAIKRTVSVIVEDGYTIDMTNILLLIRTSAVQCSKDLTPEGQHCLSCQFQLIIESIS